nr:thiamine phosphate synthase [Paenibacillus larvae]
MPIVGIGGITASRSGDVIRAGADGVAVISSITGSADPKGSRADSRNGSSSPRARRDAVRR